MAHYTVIKSDTAIYVDGVAVDGCDMSGMSDFHALQWNGSQGHVEYEDVLKPNDIITSDEELEAAVGISLSTILSRRTTRIEEIAAEED